ncbi:MAG: ATPase domain-containing protein [Actinomycetota bacterium]
MTRKRTFECTACGARSEQWAGRCAGCGGWGSVEEIPASLAGNRAGGASTRPAPVPLLSILADAASARVSTGMEGIDRVLGGGLVPASVALLAGEPGIGKSTLLLQMIANLAAAGAPCLVVSGEESHAQVAARARRLGLAAEAITFAPGRDLGSVLQSASEARPFLLAVDSIQTIRDTDGTQIPGGVSQVRTCTDALVGLAKSHGIAVLLTGHVTKDGDLAGPRALEHAVDVVLTFDGDARSGLRVLAGGKNRFGSEGETAWFEMESCGLREIDPTELLLSGERVAGAATALPLAGRRALAVEVQALVGSTEGPPRRHVTGLDLRRFQLVAAVLDRAVGFGLGRAELFGASGGGVRIDDPACDLAVAAALASAATAAAPPAGAAFVGEVALTGLVRPAPGMAQRLAAARAAGCTTVFAPRGEAGVLEGMQILPVGQVAEALSWARHPAGTRAGQRSA